MVNAVVHHAGALVKGLPPGLESIIIVINYNWAIFSVIEGLIVIEGNTSIIIVIIIVIDFYKNG